MTRSKPHLCADCGKPTEDLLLCERCAVICDALTSRGLYYAYRTGQLDPSALPVSLAGLGLKLSKRPRRR